MQKAIDILKTMQPHELIGGLLLGAASILVFFAAWVVMP